MLFRQTLLLHFRAIFAAAGMLLQSGYLQADAVLSQRTISLKPPEQHLQLSIAIKEVYQKLKNTLCKASCLLIRFLKAQPILFRIVYNLK